MPPGGCQHVPEPVKVSAGAGGGPAHVGTVRGRRERVRRMVAAPGRFREHLPRRQRQQQNNNRHGRIMDLYRTNTKRGPFAYLLRKKA